MKTIFSILFLAIVLFWALNACDYEAPKEVVTATDLPVDSLVFKQDTMSKFTIDSLK